MRLVPLVLALASASTAVHAARPEIERPVGTAQARGVAHTVRALPEACAWLQGGASWRPPSSSRAVSVILTMKRRRRR